MDDGLSSSRLPLISQSLGRKSNHLRRSRVSKNAPWESHHSALVRGDSPRACRNSARRSARDRSGPPDRLLRRQPIYLDHLGSVAGIMAMDRGSADPNAGAPVALAAATAGGLRGHLALSDGVGVSLTWEEDQSGLRSNPRIQPTGRRGAGLGAGGAFRERDKERRSLRARARGPAAAAHFVRPMPRPSPRFEIDYASDEAEDVVINANPRLASTPGTADQGPRC